ncbi:alpha-tocopherol transfer protein-like [Calliphora vicina]|uniref:alpha-tocopherol transfer protein-like n=1 Tax=Calliphora vicina TaxID=7373 RepID=UPI00325ACBEF
MSPELKCGDLLLKLDLTEPSESVQNKALEELRENPQNIQNGLKELQSRLEAETDLNIPKTNKEWLMKFLRPCHFYPESARDLIRRYYNLRRKYNEITNFLIPSKLKNVFEANLVTILPQRDQYGRRIVVSLGGKQWNHKLIPIDDVFSSSTLCSELLQLEPQTQINGIVYIMDMVGLSFSQALHFTPYKAKRLLDHIQNNIPLRVKALHIVNQPRIFQPIFAAAKPFFTSKFANRIILHGCNYESLHRYISPECLPACYGGTMNSELMYGRETYELLSYYEKYFESLQMYGFKKES